MILHTPHPADQPLPVSSEVFLRCSWKATVSLLSSLSLVSFYLTFHMLSCRNVFLDGMISFHAYSRLCTHRVPWGELFLMRADEFSLAVSKSGFIQWSGFRKAPKSTSQSADCGRSPLSVGRSTKTQSTSSFVCSLLSAGGSFVCHQPTFIQIT